MAHCVSFLACILHQMNRTQRISNDWMHRSGLDGQQFLLEALLRRGYLVFESESDIFLSQGSAEDDLAVLSRIEGLSVVSSGARDGLAKLMLDGTLPGIEVARAIIGIRENHDATHGGITTLGIGSWIRRGWQTYTRMEWGAKLAVCYDNNSAESTVYNALDTGVALLVKAFPLARVATSFSCDGHGMRPATISFFSPWDFAWAKAVWRFSKMPHPQSFWRWSAENLSLKIYPLNGYSDEEVLGMLNDIQRFARGLMKRDIIEHLGKLRKATLAEFAIIGIEPTQDQFYAEACRKLGLRQSPLAGLNMEKLF